MPPKKRKLKRRGGAVSDALKKINQLAKDTKIISKAAESFNAPAWLTGSAQALGYGRKKRKARR